MKRTVLAGLLMGLLALTGCRTTPKPGPETPVVAEGQLIAFAPINPDAAIRFKEGAYPTLFGGSSRAVWRAPETASNPESPSAELPMSGLLTIECTLESTFSDVSIAYDAVGMRGVDIYLLAPDGTRIDPVQSIVGGDLQEEGHGALKRFRRVNQLLFPKEVLQIPASRETTRAAMRLVLEAHETVFYFQWDAHVPEVNAPLKFTERKEMQAIRESSHKAHKRFLNWSHKFD